MCLIAFSWKNNPTYKLVLVANRDEFFNRPTQPLHEWQEQQILAGKDLKEGGTWMGMHKSGYFAALTNFRELTKEKSGSLSRGLVVTDYLKSRLHPLSFLQNLNRQAGLYNPFNVLVSDGKELWYYSNQGAAPQQVKPGIYGLSNAFLDTPWPKTELAKSMLNVMLKEGNQVSTTDLIAITASAEEFADLELPDTGIGLETERKLSAPFIRMDGRYGTRTTTVITWTYQNKVQYLERTFALDPTEFNDTYFEFYTMP